MLLQLKVSAPENYFTIKKRPFTGFWSRSATLNIIMNNNNDKTTTNNTNINIYNKIIMVKGIKKLL